MDKVSRKPGTKYTHELMIDKLDEIVDWINARDDKIISPICAKCKNKCKDMTDTNERCTAFEPSIEQELEWKLKEWSTQNLNQGKLRTIPTRIFLPVAKYEEYLRCLPELYAGTKVNFHDIPVFSYSGEEIIYCTDN